MSCPCEICGKEFSSPKTKTNHRRWHKTLKYVNFQKSYHRNGSKAKIGEKNPMWKGEKVKYGALHDWVKWHLVKPKNCQNCGAVKKLDCTNLSQKYLRKLDDWIWLCRRCHMKSDGRMFNLKQRK